MVEKKNKKNLFVWLVLFFLFFLFNLHFSLLFLEVTGAGLKFQEKGQEGKEERALGESKHHPRF